MLYSITDFNEIDSEENIYLCEAKMIYSNEPLIGKAIGQLLFCDFLFSTYLEKNLKELLIEIGFDEGAISKENHDDFHFKTCNILVCGGEDWKLCA